MKPFGDMKKLVCFILFTFLICNLSISQNKQNSGLLQLSIVEKSNNKLSDYTHVYDLQIVNTSNSALDFKISTNDISCKKETSKLKNEVLSNNNLKIKAQKLNSKQLHSFKIKLTRNHLTKLNTWGCLEIQATSKTGEIISNSVIISHFIPDPKDFN